MSRRSTWVLGMAVLLATSGALARPPGQGRQGAMMNLNLTPDQQKKLIDLHKDLTVKTAEPMANLRKLQADIAELWRQPSPDRNAILAKMKQMEPLRSQLHAAEVDFAMGLHDLLTPEQRNELAQSMPMAPWGGMGMMGGMGMGMMGGGMGMGMGPMGGGPGAWPSPQSQPQQPQQPQPQQPTR